jgi:hypothetical protein
VSVELGPGQRLRHLHRPTPLVLPAASPDRGAGAVGNTQGAGSLA